MSKLIVELPEELHASLKRQAVEEQKTLKTIVIALLDQYLESPRVPTRSKRATGLCGAWHDARSANTIVAEVRGARRWWTHNR